MVGRSVEVSSRLYVEKNALTVGLAGVDAVRPPSSGPWDTFKRSLEAKAGITQCCIQGLLGIQNLSSSM